ncbi:hypothetical protein AB0O91_38005 [Kitasatospora sp. NPDC089797]|uniref:hypothetical protein n=1 Tax=Kitasatospora sp. NPDC089797 TaxID=3155298 RepID=UPI0034348A98
MGTVVALLAGLAFAVIAAIVYLARRDRLRRSQTDDMVGLLIEQQRTSQAARIRSTYSSASLHHGTGLVSDDMHKYYS